MKRFVWLGLLFFSTSWFFFFPFFTPPDTTLGIAFVIFGILCTIVSLRNRTLYDLKKQNLLFLIPLLIAIILVEFPYSIGLIVLFVGFLILAGSSLFPRISKVKQIWPGFLISGSILTIQAAFFPIIVKIAARNHGIDLPSPFVTAIGNTFGLHIVQNGDRLFLGAIKSSPILTFSWESLGIYLWIFYLIGVIILFFSSFKKANKRSIGIALSSFCIISMIYLLLRYVTLLIFLMERIEGHQSSFLVPLLDIFFDPMHQFLSFLPFTFIVMWFIPLKDLEIDVSWMKAFSLKKRQIVVYILIFTFVCSATAAFAFQDSGLKKMGRLLIDEYHSDWEDSIGPVDTEWYGELSTYNYYSFAEWLGQYYTVEKNENNSLTEELLSNYDILMLKCPTNPYSDTEVSAIVKFVENGGGLYMIGDHTNVFGMNSYLNKIAHYFGIKYNTDATHQYSKPGGFSVFVPSKILPHPIVQYMTSFQFLTSDTLNAPLTAEDVITGEELTTFPGTYSTRAFFIEDKGIELTKGFFLQSVALKYGRGRVVAYTDSTTFSTYCIFLDGYQAFNLGTMEYLNRENVFSYLNPIFGLLAIICLITVLVLLRSEQITKILTVCLVIGALAGSLVFPTLTAFNRSTYPPPHPLVPFDKQICFEDEYSNIVIFPFTQFEQEDAIRTVQKRTYNTFFVWTQRINCTPSLKSTLQDAMTHGDLVVIINPAKHFTQETITAVKAFLLNGGKLLVMDSIYNVNSTSNDLLSQFNMQLSTIEQPSHIDVAGTATDSIFNPAKNLSIGSTIQPMLLIKGGRTILCSVDGRPSYTVQTHGKGLLAVFVDSATFSDYKMGGTFTIPDSELRKLYDTQYYIFESLLYDESDMIPAEMQGYVYRDINSNRVYDPQEDQVLLNATVSGRKVDDITTNTVKTYLTSFETVTNEKGHYSLLNLMPGHYLINVTMDGFLIHQSSILSLSGEKQSYNISQAKPASLQGIVYYDKNKNGRYEQEEEFSSIFVELLYINATNGETLVVLQVTNATGTYSFSSIPPGRYRLDATKYNKTMGHPEYNKTVLLLVSENTTIVRDIALDVAPVTVYGTTYYSNHSKENILVLFTANTTLKNNTATNHARIRSNASGLFQLSLTPGCYNISINQTINENGHEIRYIYSGEMNIVIGEGIKMIYLPLSIRH